MAILWCLSRSALSYGLIDDRDWFELHVLLLVLSYDALRVAQAWGIPAVYDLLMVGGVSDYGSKKDLILKAKGLP